MAYENFYLAILIFYCQKYYLKNKKNLALNTQYCQIKICLKDFNKIYCRFYKNCGFYLFYSLLIWKHDIVHNIWLSVNGKSIKNFSIYFLANFYPLLNNFSYLSQSPELIRQIVFICYFTFFQFKSGSININFFAIWISFGHLCHLLFLK